MNSNQEDTVMATTTTDTTAFVNDPYAFPYFHSSEEIPALYKTVNNFINLQSSSVSLSSKLILSQNLRDKIFKLSKEKVYWVDSCGENALHRLCQFTRFGNSDLDQVKYQVIKCLVESDSRVVYTVNNWNETPLHQFVTHLGLTLESQDQSRKEEGMNVKVLKLLATASPYTLLIKNYQQALPIHDACRLANIVQQESNQNWSFPFENLTCEEIQSGVLNSDGEYAMQHLQMISYLIHQNPKCLLYLDMKRKTPLYAAVESIHCSTRVVEYILRSMERVFGSNEFFVMIDPTKGLMKKQHAMHTKDGCSNLLRRAILGTSMTSNSSKSNEQKNADYNMDDSTRQDKPQTGEIASPLQGIFDVITQERVSTESMLDIVQNATNSIDGLSSIGQVLFEYSIHDHDMEDLLNFVQQLGSIWEKMILLMCCAYHGSMKHLQNLGTDASRWYPIHAAIYCKAPLPIICGLCKLYPQELLKQRGSKHETPLIMFLNSDIPSRYLGRCNELQSTISYLIGKNAEAASMPDIHGRLPLHCALEQELDWDLGLNNILMAYRSAASITDPTSGLVPVLRASSKQYDLSTIYAMLHVDPTVLRMSKSK
ncbi:hypothetical protein CTEN210_00258 [Chaetoceros tenuissimus]|uniref:Uncharacterized protein n=1 Tax=Chaetoceros tenuissimus TaxID=426638 RepID=A0AAD3CFN5_9STRA|nr:hypothetical protein CTEN210_00258 [Chaetoceros tenuissimus]